MEIKPQSSGGYIIAETSTSQWNYHLRRLDERGPQYSGADKIFALCGKRVGWDSKIPLSAWGAKDHIPTTWCKKCEALKK